MRATWTLYSEKRIEPERLRMAAAKAFQLRSEDIKLLEGSILKAPPARIYIEEYDFGEERSSEFRFEIDLCIESELYADTGYPAKGSDGLVKDNLNLAKKIASVLGEPLIGNVEDYNNNDIYYIKCYPDGREERVEWPEAED